MITKITHVTLFVHNQDDALQFYKDKLGFAVHTDAPFGEMRWLTLHLPDQKDVELVIMLASTPQEKALVGKQNGDKPLLCVATNDCKGDYARLLKLGVEFVEAPQEQPWGIAATCKDLYGNKIYMVEAR